MKSKLLSCFVLLLALLAVPAVASAASGVVNVQMKGAGTIRIDNNDGLANSDDHQGETCGGSVGSVIADLSNPTGHLINSCVQNFSIDHCPPGQGPDCTLTATASARVPSGQFKAGDVRDNWRFSGWSQAPTPECTLANGSGAAATCTFKFATCTNNVCTPLPPITLVADFRDNRPPGVLFDCRPSGGACQPIPTTPVVNGTGQAPFQARSDEFLSVETATIQCQVDNETVNWTPCEAATPMPAGNFRTPIVSDGAHTLRIRAADPSGNVSAVVKSMTWTQRYPPITKIFQGPADNGSVASRLPEFKFATANFASTFRCALDSDTPVDCSTGSFKPSTPLAEGAHTFRVTATRKDVAVDELSPPLVHFSVDVSMPHAVITGGPEEGLVTTNRGAAFTFATDPPEQQTGFQCALDDAMPAPCNDQPVQYAGLPAGLHHFRVSAIDSAGNQQQPPLVRSWTVIADADGDGFYAPDNDCDDTNPRIRPGAIEIQGNGIDENCDGIDPPNTDADGDGAQAAPGGPDCDDTNPKIHPGANEILGNGIDENCDGVDPPNLDKDSDGSLARPAGQDCDDLDASVHPGAKDIPENGKDEDCDGEDAFYPLIDVRFPSSWVPGRSATEVVSVAIAGVPKGATIAIRCRGACSGGTKMLRVGKARARMELKRYLDARYRTGAVLEVRVSKAKRSSEGSTWKMRRGKAPKQQTFCVLGGKRKTC